MKFFLRSTEQLPSLLSLKPGQSFERWSIDGKFLNSGVLSEDLEPGDELYILCGPDGDVVRYTIVGPAATVIKNAGAIPVAPHESIDVLGLRASTSKYLKADNIVIVGDLLEKTENQLLRVPNLGRKAVNEIKKALAARGRSLKAEPLTLDQK